MPCSWQESGHMRFSRDTNGLDLPEYDAIMLFAKAWRGSPRFFIYYAGKESRF